MKKIFTILLALSALGIVISGCSKPADDANANTTAPAAGGDTAKTEEGK